jgi:hypothetical protein
MSKLLTSATVAVTLLVGAATVQAQQAPSVATLPPQGTSVSDAPSTVAPSPKYVGPAPGITENATFGASTGQVITPSPKYVGPALGAAEGANYASSAKPAGYEGDVTLHPYTTTGMGPKAN